MLNAVTGIGIAGVKVEILQAGKPVYSTTTDARGHFRVESVKDGTYTATYSAQHYWPSDPGTPGPFQADMSVGTQAFQVTAGGSPVKVEAHMMPLCPGLPATSRMAPGKACRACGWNWPGPDRA